MNKENSVILIGGGGHARVLIDLIRMSGLFNIAGIIDHMLEPGSLVSGVPVIGNDSMLSDVYKKGIVNGCIAVGSIKENSKRKMLYEKVRQVGFDIPFLIHHKAMVSQNSTKISTGVQVMAGAVIQTGTTIGENTIINTGAIVEHDCTINNHVHVCPGAILSGGCTVHDGAFIGAGATLIQGVRIGKNAVIAAGSVVLHDVAEGITVKGVPAK